jgi:hypothetical protein
VTDGGPSEEFAKEVEEVARKHVADDEYVTGWYLVVSTSLSDDPKAVAYYHLEPGQHPHVSHGLVVSAYERTLRNLRDGEGVDDSS